jgi:hypothetical protein
VLGSIYAGSDCNFTRKTGAALPRPAGSVPMDQSHLVGLVYLCYIYPSNATL